VEDGSCEYPGCTDTSASNFQPNANKDDDSCTGCTETSAVNYCQSCKPDQSDCLIFGCMDSDHEMYNSKATESEPCELIAAIVESASTESASLDLFGDDTSDDVAGQTIFSLGSSCTWTPFTMIATTLITALFWMNLV
jgi:hypothetical protein